MNPENKKYRYKDVLAQGSGESKGWMASYGDLITVLLCFFMLFYSKEKNITKSKFYQQILDLKNELTENSKPKPLKDSFLDSRIGTELAQTQILNDLIFIESIPDTQILTYSNYVLLKFPKVNLFERGEDEISLKHSEKIIEISKKLSRYRNDVKINIIAYADGTRVIDNKDHWWKNNEDLTAARALSVQRLFYNNGFVPGDVIITGAGVKTENDEVSERTVEIKIESRR